MGDILERHHALRRDLKAADKPAWRDSVDELDRQLRALIYPGFVTATPPDYLRHLPRYLKAAALRLQKLQREPGKDRQRAAEMRPLAELWQTRLDGLREQHKEVDDAVLNFRWRLEELRVSLFAQELGTAQPVSATRLQKEWQRLTTP